MLTERINRKLNLKDTPFSYLDAEPVAEVVDVLGVVLHQRHVITRHHHIQRPVRRFRGSQDWF